MKRLIIMLLIASSAAVPTLAQSKSKAQKKYDLTIMTDKEQQYPLRVFRLLRDIRDKFGMRQGQTYSVLKNPNTGLIESAERITRFSCLVDELKTIDRVFMDDEPFSYQILHLLPGNTQQFDIKVVSADGQRSSTLPIRTKSSQEMWYLAAKNLENPQLRPDLYTKNVESSKRMFKIEGRVDENIKDSLYNIYIANTHEALNALGDNEYVACVPVVNKRFEWQTELDHPCVGRLRCIFPDGSLCSAWIDLDFVPGETYHITVHNGYYDDDVAYEQRVGRLSGKSLITPLEKKDSLETADEWRKSLTQEQMEKGEIIKNAINDDMEMIYEYYQQIKNESQSPSTLSSRDRVDMLYKQIINKNKTLDSHIKELVKIAKDVHVSVDLYKTILKIYGEQNQIINELRKSGARFTSNARKLQKYINGQIEKYLNEMSKL